MPGSTRAVAFLALLGALCVLQVREVRRTVRTGDPQLLAIGVAAPALDVPGRGVARVRLAEQAGKFTVVCFWASWCLPCRVELQELARFAEVWNEQGDHERELVLLAIHVGDDSSGLAHVLDDPSYGAVRFGFDRDGAAGEAWNVRGVPTTFLIGPGGRVVDAFAGYRDSLRARLRTRLAACEAKR